MGHLLLALEHIAFWTCLGALVGRGVMRWRAVSRHRWLPILVGVLALAPLLLVVLLVWSVSLGWLRQGGFGGNSRTLPFDPLVIRNIAVVWTTSLAFAAISLIAFARRPTPHSSEENRWPTRSLVFALASVAMVHAITFWNLDLTARQQLESLRVEAGALAVSLSPPAVIDSENAAVVYQEVFDSGLLGTEPAPYAKWFELYGESPERLPVKDPEFVAFVSGRKALAERIAQAAELPSCNFRRDWGRPSFAMLLPETQNLRACARELVLAAHFQADQGNTRLALRYIAAMHRIADHAGQEPILISQLVSMAIEHMAVMSLEHILRSHPATKEELAELNDWPLHSHTIRSQSALRMEQAFGLATVNDLLTHPGAWGIFEQGMENPPAILLTIYRVFFVGNDLRRYQQHMTNLQNAAIAGYKGRRDTADQVDKSLKDADRGVMADLLLPAFGQLNVAIGRADARQRLARLAIAMHRHRLEHGSFPESLEELSGSLLIPRDPFDDQPLRVTRRDGRLLLYSIGANLKDDAGQPEPSRSGQPIGNDEREGDLIFWLE